MKQASKCFSLSLNSIGFNLSGLEIGSGIFSEDFLTRLVGDMALGKSSS
jgi:hypothetical protein